VDLDDEDDGGASSSFARSPLDDVPAFNIQQRIHEFSRQGQHLLDTGINLSSGFSAMSESRESSCNRQPAVAASRPEYDPDERRPMDPGWSFTTASTVGSCVGTMALPHAEAPVEALRLLPPPHPPSPQDILAARISDELALVEVLVRIQSELASIGDTQVDESAGGIGGSGGMLLADQDGSQSHGADVVVPVLPDHANFLPPPSSGLLPTVATKSMLPVTSPILKPAVPSPLTPTVGLDKPASMTSSLLPNARTTDAQQPSINKVVTPTASTSTSLASTTHRSAAHSAKTTPKEERRNMPQENKLVLDKKALEDQIISMSRSALKPHYHSGRITAQEYKTIMKKAIAKIGGSAAGEINERRVTKFINAYVEKVIMER
jgi:hypothetical protein